MSDCNCGFPNADRVPDASHPRTCPRNPNYEGPPPPYVQKYVDAAIQRFAESLCRALTNESRDDHCADAKEAIRGVECAVRDVMYRMSKPGDDE